MYYIVSQQDLQGNEAAGSGFPILGTVWGAHCQQGREDLWRARSVDLHYADTAAT